MSVCITFDTVAPFLRIYLTEITADMDKGARRRMFVEASVLIAKKKNPQKQQKNRHE